MLEYITVVAIKEHLQKRGYPESRVRDILVTTLKNSLGWCPRSVISWYVTKYDKGVDLHEIDDK